MVRKAKIQVADRGTGLLQEFPNGAQGYDLNALSQFLQRVKERFPSKLDATILLEQDIPYDTLVQVMDTVRVVEQKQERTHRTGGALSGDLDWRCAAMRLSNRSKRMIIHQERNRAGVSLNLIPMIDILSVMVAFLLVYSTEVEVLQNTKGIEIPESVAEQKPRETVVIMITRDELLVQGQAIARIADIEKMEGTIIAPLKSALERPTVAMPRRVLERDIASRELTIMGDKVVPYNVLKKVMATCTDANFGRISLAVLQKDKPVAIAHSQ